jgi:tRNA(Ile)-lysidine synthase
MHDPFLSGLLASAAPQLEALRGRTVVVAVSGGADSTALLHALTRLQDRLALRLVAAHLDHGLRPESAEDARLVAEMVGALGVEFRSARADVRERASVRGSSLEEAARELRYSYLTGVAREVGATLAVAHNRNDQAETVLFNLVRGAGAAGLAGMRPVSPTPGAPDVPLVRPFLGMSAAQIREYCARHSLPVLEDPTNEEVKFTRNRVRREVIPALERVNTRAVEHIVQAARAVREDADALDALALELYDRAAREQPGAALLDADILRDEAPALRGRAVRLAVGRIAGGLHDFSTAHVGALDDLLTGGRAGRELQLPGGVTALTVSAGLVLWRGEFPVGLAYGLPLLEDVNAEPLRLADGWSFRSLEGRCLCASGGAGEGLHEHVRAARGAYRLRAPAPRLRFRPLGATGSKPVYDFLADAKVPRALRPRVPVVECEGEVVWVVGWRLDDGWRLTRPGEPFVCLLASRSRRLDLPTDTADAMRE